MCAFSERALPELRTDELKSAIGYPPTFRLQLERKEQLVSVTRNRVSVAKRATRFQRQIHPTADNLKPWNTRNTRNLSTRALRATTKPGGSRSVATATPCLTRRREALRASCEAGGGTACRLSLRNQSLKRLWKALKGRNLYRRGERSGPPAVTQTSPSPEGATEGSYLWLLPSPTQIREAGAGGVGCMSRTLLGKKSADRLAPFQTSLGDLKNMP